MRAKTRSFRAATVVRTALVCGGCLAVVWLYVSWQLLLASTNPNTNQRIFDANGTQDPTGGAFIHIGKTGGSTLSKLMRNGCPSMVTRPCYQVTHETVASKLIHSYYHVMDFGLLPKSNHDFYLLSLRDPYDRFVSAFCYDHIRNQGATNRTAPVNRYKLRQLEKAYECFPTLEDFAAYFTQGDPFLFHYPYKYNVIEPNPCRDFALAVFHGRVRAFHHLYFNYQHILKIIPQPEQQIILATRLERLWEDWTAVNVYLGQSADTIVIPDEHVRDTSQLNLPVNKTLSGTGREAICAALQLEYNAYFWFLSRARNLQKGDLAAALWQARQHCPSVQLDFRALQQK